MILNLTYPLNDKAFGYGNGDRLNLVKARNMCCGDTSNNSVINMPTHYGTHIDYPFHFSEEGKNSSDYSIENFIFDKVKCIEIDENEVDDYLIRNNNFNIEGDLETELLFIKTGFCDKRNTNEYWEFGFGFHRETARFLKNKYPNLKAIAFDLISLNSYQNRAEGRIAHKEFLTVNDVLIVEEVDLRKVNSKTIFNNVIIAPLQLEDADGAPVTIIARINE